MITTLTGTNHFLIAQKLRDITGKFINQYGDLSVERLDAENIDIGHINESLRNLPFLIQKKPPFPEAWFLLMLF